MRTIVHATDHAIVRYLERVETCSVADVRDRLRHAFEISVPASARHMKAAGLGRNVGVVRRYCAVENLLLVCKPAHNGYVILTVLRAEKNAQKRRRQVA